MGFQYCVVEVTTDAWKEIMDSDVDDEGNQHLNHWGKKGWEIQCVVPRLENGTTVGYGIVFKKNITNNDD